MDIPNTGAIFTLGKSHLAENTQSYFYIKNDPIKRLIAGPYQSAVICESGRLFVWGENHHGQLGIGAQQSSNTNNNNNSSGHIIIKPTCVKSLKTLGLKIADISFGNNWSIILTLSNELFFTGRNIFASECTVSRNFTEATVNGESYAIIRKPFRLEEFDDYLSNNEETENFIQVLAGNEHFVLLTSFGRLIGWGSNQSNQLGKSKEEEILKPHEIILNSSIQLYTCGPESTLLLTENGKLFLTGRLNELSFPDFTELQNNLLSNEQILFMNISKANEIFIHTNMGRIYRSYESVHNKSLIFQRFYDYDSEENGPIWKLLKGTSFFAVLTKTNKFYTTFSESGHHLKTFIEISKFKNLRILDMAIGDNHILVHGIPRASTLAATVGTGAEQRYITQSIAMANTTNGALNRTRNSRSMVLYEAPSNILNDNQEKNDQLEIEEKIVEKDVKFNDSLNRNDLYLNDIIGEESTDSTYNRSAKESEESLESFETGKTVVNKKSPTKSLNSQPSITSSPTKELESETLSVKSLRPRTPLPETSSQGPMKKTSLRNLSYEAAISNDIINQTSPVLAESLENIPEVVGKEGDLSVSLPTQYSEDDEELRLEISETTDPLDHTVTVNEIRFINNGIDVTANVKKLKLDGSDESLDATEEEDEDNKNDGEIDKFHIRKEAENFIDELENEITKQVKTAKANKQAEENSLEDQSKSLSDEVKTQLRQTKETGDNVDFKLAGAHDTLESTVMKVATGAREAERNISNNTKNERANGTKESIENMGNSMAPASDEAHQVMSHMSDMAKAAGDAKNAMNSTLSKITVDTKYAVSSVTTKISNELQDAKISLSSMLQGKKNKVDIQKPSESLHQEDDLQSEATSKESDGDKSNATTQSNNTATSVQEDDERTTASANSNHNASADNTLENTDSFDPELDAMVQRGKQALREELQAASVAAENKTEQTIDDVVENKNKLYKFLGDIKERSKSLSCGNDKSIKIITDQPPRYSIEDELAEQPSNNGSKVCTIL